jgi:hypothetical protein
MDFSSVNLSADETVTAGVNIIFRAMHVSIDQQFFFLYKNKP